MTARMAASLARYAFISAIANDACPGLMGAKQQKRNSTHQRPHKSFAGCEPWFCHLPRQCYLLPTSFNQATVLPPEPLWRPLTFGCHGNRIITTVYRQSFIKQSPFHRANIEKE
jgi:hypothetical protein